MTPSSHHNESLEQPDQSKPNSQAPFSGEYAGELSSDVDASHVGDLAWKQELGLSWQVGVAAIVAAFCIGMGLKLMVDAVVVEDEPLTMQDIQNSVYENIMSEDQLDETIPSQSSTEPLPPFEVGEGASPLKSQTPAPEVPRVLGPAPQIISPFHGAEISYDLTKGPALFEWQGQATHIVFSRHRTMKPIARRFHVSGQTSYAFRGPAPGVWYWRLDRGGEPGEARSFRVTPPIARTFPIQEPLSDTQIPAEGALVRWQTDAKITWYKALVFDHISGQQVHMQGTSGDHLRLKQLKGGIYDLKLGGFSEVSGKWEWQLVQRLRVL